MTNQSGKRQSDQFRPGDILQAGDLNRIVDSLMGRIEGGKGIRVHSFGDQLILDGDPEVVIRRSVAESFAIVRDDANLSGFHIAVDIYGPKPASFGLDAEGVQKAPTQEDIGAWRIADWFGYNRIYQHGELVTVIYVVDGVNPPHYTIDKLHESDLREVIQAGQVAVTRGLDGLAFDAFAVMETYLRRESEAEGGVILSTGPGRTIYTSGFWRCGTVTYWPILYAADIAAISEVYDTVASWGVIENWLNYHDINTSSFDIPGEVGNSATFSFIPDTGGIVHLPFQTVTVGVTQHVVVWDSTGVGVGTFTPVGFVLPAGSWLHDLPASNKWNYYEWGDFTCTTVYNPSCTYDRYLETRSYGSSDDGAVAARFWADRNIDGVIVDHRELEALHSVTGDVVGQSIQDYYGAQTVVDGTYAARAYRPTGTILAEFHWDGKNLATPHVNVGDADWTYE